VSDDDDIGGPPEEDKVEVDKVEAVGIAISIRLGKGKRRSRAFNTLMRSVPETLVESLFFFSICSIAIVDDAICAIVCEANVEYEEEEEEEEEVVV
jgi:hypothetical protein